MYNEKLPNYNYKSRLTDPSQPLNPLELQQELRLSGAKKKNVASFPNDQRKSHWAEARNFTLFVPAPKAGPLPEATFPWFNTGEH